MLTVPACSVADARTWNNPCRGTENGALLCVALLPTPESTQPKMGLPEAFGSSVIVSLPPGFFPGAMLGDRSRAVKEENMVIEWF